MPVKTRAWPIPGREGSGRIDWLPSMDLNHDKQIQSLLCYRYTTRQSGAQRTLEISP